MRAISKNLLQANKAVNSLGQLFGPGGSRYNPEQLYREPRANQIGSLKERAHLVKSAGGWHIEPLLQEHQLVQVAVCKKASNARFSVR